ncbi:hypothetical protein SASPL_137877 [Salvia splendens]|uniref:HAT C-terminal dimerisation domain-containing protein n=1 Tax=Salvia splendens TaxID=180675 RepID=A0A8X8WU92_SALSN|nr:hypothetical protein SASPL_137877 [Salvia splendens]
MKHVQYCLKTLYGDAQANELVEELRNEDDDDKDGSSELTRYFTEKQYKASEHEHFDILMWWKTYSISFPILLEMTKDILAIPISSVASKFGDGDQTRGHVQHDDPVNTKLDRLLDRFDKLDVWRDETDRRFENLEPVLSREAKPPSRHDDWEEYEDMDVRGKRSWDRGNKARHQNEGF